MGAFSCKIRSKRVADMRQTTAFFTACEHCLLVKRVDSITWMFSDRGSTENVARLFIMAERLDRDFRIMRCSGFDGERFAALLDVPCVVCTLQKPESDYILEELGAMRRMAGLKELQELVLKITSGPKPFKTWSSPAVNKMPPFDRVAEPAVATLHVSVTHNRKSGRTIVRNKLSGFEDGPCSHLRGAALFPEISRFAAASRAGGEGTMFS